MKKILSISIITIILSGACRKTGFGSIEGAVYENGTNEPISNIYVYLSWTDGHKEWQKKELTDASGRFKIKFYKDTEKTYRLSAYSAAHYGMVDEGSYGIEKRKTKHDIYLNPFAEIQFRIINTTSVSTVVDMPYQFYYQAKPNHDTILPKRIKANGFGKTKIGYNVGPTSNLTDIYIYSKNSVYTHTISIN